MATSNFQNKATHENSIKSPRVPTHSQDAEQGVIGAMMLDNRAWDRVLDVVSADDFYRADHRLIFQAIADLAKKNKPFDVLTIAETLKQLDLLDKAGGEAYLFELAQNTPSAANVVAYAEIVREKSVLRQLISAGTDIIENAFNPSDTDVKELLDTAERHVFKIAEQRARGEGPQKIGSLLVKTTELIDNLYHSKETVTGLSTGFNDFDEMTSGLQKGDLIIIAGRPSMGKTILGMNIAEHAAIKGNKPILVFSMEMSAEQLAMRMMSSLGRIDQHKVRTGKLSDDDWPRITSAVSMLSDANMYIDDTPALSPSEVRSRSRRIAREHGELGLIVIDYLQLMQLSSTKENRTNEISEISRTLKGDAPYSIMPGRTQSFNLSVYAKIPAE